MSDVVRPIVRPARKKKRVPTVEGLRRARVRAKQKKAQEDRDRSKARIAAGLCYRCGKHPPWRPNKACEFCLEKMVDARKARKNR